MRSFGELAPESAGPDTFDEEKTMLKTIRRLWNDEQGVTAIEYGLLAALIAVAIIAAVVLVGQGLNNTFDKVQSNLNK